MIEAMKQALEAMDTVMFDGGWYQAKEDLRQAIARAEHLEAEKERSSVKQEPVAWAQFSKKGNLIDLLEEPCGGYVPLYTSPPQRQWVGLTDEEVREIIYETGFGLLMNVWFDGHDGNPRKVLQALEAKLKEKNT